MNRHRVVIVRPVPTDRHGDPVDEAAVPQRFEVDGVIIAPRGSSEVENYSNTVLTDFTAFWPPGADLPLPGDLVEWAGGTYSVDGTPATWSSPFSEWTPGAQVALTTREG